MTRYKIIRFYQRTYAQTTLRGKTGLTLEQAQRHCADPETSSSTAISATARRRTERRGPWFDGYTEER